MPISKDHLVDVLRIRYDAYSAEAVFTNACARAGLDGTTSFDQGSLATFRAALEQVGDRVGGVLSRIDALLADGSPATSEPAVEPKAEPAPGKKAKTKGESKAETAPETTAETESKSDAAPEPASEAKAEIIAASEPGAVDPAMAATIMLGGIELEDGEELLVCGASAALGDWDPEHARPMVRAGEHWLVTLDLPPDAEVAFKFLVRDSGGEVTWEAGDNRSVRASERLDATWRDLS